MAGSRRERLSSCCERKPSRSTFCPPRAGSPFERFQRLAAPFPSHCNCPAGCRSLGEPREDLLLRSPQSGRLEGDPEPTDSTNVRGVSLERPSRPLRGASARGLGGTSHCNSQAAGAFQACGHAGPRHRGFGAGRTFSRAWAPKPVTNSHSLSLKPQQRTRAAAARTNRSRSPF